VALLGAFDAAGDANTLAKPTTLEETLLPTWLTDSSTPTSEGGAALEE
jgi:hypothetical protein